VKSPAFQWYPSDYFASERVQLMTLEEEGIYTRLLGYCWLHGSIPSDPEQAAKLVGKGASTTLVTKVQAMFHQNGTTGRLVHDRLDVEREKQAAWRAKSSAGGKLSGAIRRGEKTKQRVVEAPLNDPMNQKATLQSSAFSLQSSVSIPNTVAKATRVGFVPPTLDELQRFGQTLEPPLPIKEADNAFDYWEGNGWKTGRNPIKKWEACLRKWHRNWQDGAFSNRNGNHSGSSASRTPEPRWQIEKRLNAAREALRDVGGDVAGQPQMSADRAKRRESLRTEITNLEGQLQSSAG